MDIYGTLGPACLDLTILEQMFKNGMTGIRLNLSHTTLKEAADMISLYHQAAHRAGITQPKLLVDMQGPELRIGKFSEPFHLQESEEIILGEAGIPVPTLIFPYLKKDQQILLDDGKILLSVLEGMSSKESVRCRVIRGGILTQRKSIALPGCNVSAPTLTNQDILNLKDAVAYGVTGIMQPFVRDKQDLLNLRNAMESAGCGHLKIFAKIENLNGVEHLKDFFDVADEIVIARGDLGNAMPLWKLPGTQKRIARACREADMPFMVVTQMLQSMQDHAVPTRAEVSDIYNAVCDGATSVMVTGETAVGSYPAEVIKYLTNTAMEAWNNIKEKRS